MPPIALMATIGCLSATTLDLDRQSGIGTAYNALFHIKDMPIIYWPYMTFPIDNRRRSGFFISNSRV